MSYYYLISSLPMLEFNKPAPISYKEFMSKCEEQLGDRDIAILKNAVINKEAPVKEGNNVLLLQKWQDFEVSLKNELARSRAIRKEKDPYNYIRGDGYVDPFIAVFAHLAVNNESIMDAEIYLDSIKWDKIDELTAGHYFDLGSIIGYSLKLQILERWANINNGSGNEALGALLGREKA